MECVLGSKSRLCIHDVDTIMPIAELYNFAYIVIILYKVLYLKKFPETTRLIGTKRVIYI